MTRLLRSVADGVTSAFVLLALAGGVAAVLVARDDVRLARVTSGSMAPELPVGALVAAVPERTVEVGDVVLFRPPPPFADAAGTPVAHRVVGIDDQGGRRLVRTRGDANAAPDPWVLDAAGTTFFRVAGHSLAAGRLTASVDPTNPRTAANLVLLPAWYIVLRLIWSDRKPPRHRAALPARPRRALVA